LEALLAATEILTLRSGGGGGEDDQVMYGDGGDKTTSSAGANPSSTTDTPVTAAEIADRPIQSERDIGTGAGENPGMVSRLG